MHDIYKTGKFGRKKTSRSSGHSSWDFVFDEKKCQASIKKA